MLDVLSLVEDALAADDPAAASTAFFRSLAPLGVTYLQTRLYRRPSAALTSASHWAAGGVVARIAPEAWPGSAAFNYVCFEQNPLLRPIGEGLTRYRFSDFAPRGEARFGAYWEALGEAGVQDALCATAYGPDRRIASLHLGFGAADLDPDAAWRVQMAGLVLCERIMARGEPPAAGASALTPRERDVLRFVAAGKSDWEIGKILSVAEATARFHADNARRKLGAVNRAQAVAICAAARLL